MRPVRYYEMRPHQIREVREEFPVAYLPMGVLEWHGEHNPVGLDAVKATAMAEYFATHTGGLVMPTFWWGDNRSSLAELVFDEETSGDFDHRPGIIEGHGLTLKAFEEDARRSEEEGGWKLYESVLRHALHEIATFGFEVIVTIAGHYPLIGPSTDIAMEFNQTGRATVVPIIGFDLVQDRFSGDHAAQWETSLMMYLRPELVDIDRLDPMPESAPIGVLGKDPRPSHPDGGASADYGRQGVEAMNEALAAKIGEALGE